MREATKYIIGGTEIEPAVVIAAARASSGVLISPWITLEIDPSMILSTVESMGFTIMGIAEIPISVGQKCIT